MAEEPMPTDDQLRGFIVRFSQAGKHEPGDRVAVLNEFGDDYFHLHGLVQRVRRLAQAYLQLERKGFATEARILARAALEHAVTGQWIFYTVDGLSRFRVSVAKDELKLFTTVGSGEEVLAGLRATIPEGKGMYNWTDLSAELDDGSSFIAHTYSVLSQIVHVTHSTVMDSLDVREDGVLYLRDEPEPWALSEILFALAASCMLVWWLEVVMTGDEKQQKKLHENSHELHLPMRLDENLPDERRRVAGPAHPAH